MIDKSIKKLENGIRIFIKSRRVKAILTSATAEFTKVHKPGNRSNKMFYFGALEIAQLANELRGCDQSHMQMVPNN